MNLPAARHLLSIIAAERSAAAPPCA